MCWSTPEDDLAAWRYEGVVYRRQQHPDPKRNTLFAPDVARGSDGRYYLYYSDENNGIISVAVCDSPAGKYTYLGDVHTKDGHVYGSSPEDWFNFDPAVLVDTDGRIWLYSGSGQKFNETFGHPVVGCFVMELEPDMLTICSKPRVLLPADERIDRPSFFEGSSIRHIGELYYLVYPATDMTGLNYATSRFPDRDFVYRGRIHSSSDIGYAGRALTDPHYPIGNNHGGLMCANGQWYIFDHRMTNRTFFSRQGVAEPVTIGEDGTIEMAECTSCGLNGGPLEGRGTYPAYIACVLMSGHPLDLEKLAQAGAYMHGEDDPTQRAMRLFDGPYVTQDEPDYDPEQAEAGAAMRNAQDKAKDSPTDQKQVQDHEFADAPIPYISGIRDGSVIGYKYFDFEQATGLSLTLRGEASGKFIVRQTEKGEPVGEVPILLSDAGNWTEFPAKLPLTGKRQGLFLTWEGTGEVEMLRFAFR